MRIVCASLPGPGHGHPMLAVAAALVRRGHDVVFLSGEAHRADAPAIGARFELLPSAGGSPLHALRPYDDAAAQALALREILDEIRPDAALVDVITVGAALGMELLGIPFATMVVHPLHTPSRALPPFGYGRRAGRDPLMRFRDAWMRANNRKDLERARADLNRNRAALNIALNESLDVGLSDSLVVIATLPSLEILRADWPPHAHIVGPCLWDVLGEPFQPPPGDRPLVMIAPSTAYDGDRMLAPALGAVAKLGVRGVVTAGAAAVPGALPANVLATNARHADVLPHVAAVVCNGGHGTVVRALSAGVPLVVVPGHGDQQENAFRVERAGAGIQVRRRKPTPAPIARALARVLTRASYTDGARRIAAEARAIDGPERAAALFEEAFARTPETTEGGLVPAPLPNGGLVSNPPRSPRGPAASP